MKFTRRSFLRNSLAAGAAVSLPARIYSQAPGANSDIRMAVIGFNGRGKDHIAEIGKLKGVRVTALCDVDYKVLEGKSVDVEDIRGRSSAEQVIRDAVRLYKDRIESRPDPSEPERA